MEKRGQGRTRGEQVDVRLQRAGGNNGPVPVPVPGLPHEHVVAQAGVLDPRVLRRVGAPPAELKIALHMSKAPHILPVNIKRTSLHP